ncbi:MAG: hypothetical protein NUV46_01345 [Nanoarchaeota archaeon]|nr:hypothetical protein [Nanoarchaeota archaeon]
MKKIGINYISGGVNYILYKMSEGPVENPLMTKNLEEIGRHLLENKNELQNKEFYFSNNFPKEDKKVIELFLEALKD